MRVKGTAISMQVTVQFDRQKLHPQCDWPILRLRFCTHHPSGPSSWSMLASGVLLRSNFQDDLRRRHRFVGRNARCKHVFPGPAEYLAELSTFPTHRNRQRRGKWFKGREPTTPQTCSLLSAALAARLPVHMVKRRASPPPLPFPALAT